MHRRAFIKGSGLGLAATTLAAPAIAQGQPEIKWRMASSFPKNLDALFGAGEQFCKRIAAITDNKFQIRIFAAGEIVPGLQVLDAVQNNTVECGHTGSTYYIGKDMTFLFDTAVPFGMNTRQQYAWQFFGGGHELLADFFKDYGVVSWPLGQTGAQMGGWFKKEIKTLDDLKGLKFRIAGFGGQVFAKLGAVPQQIAGGDIYPALEKGTIDGAEWVGPYDDEKLGFQKVAPYYYYPGWWEGCAQPSLYVNQKAWDSLPPAYQNVVEAVSMEVDLWMLAKYDAGNPAALRRLVAGGTQLKPFSRPIMEAAHKATIELCEELSAKNPKFKKIYEPWKKFRDEEILWFQVVEQSFDNYMAAASRKS